MEPMRYACSPEPEVKVRLESGGRTLDFMLSLHCSTIELYYGEGKPLVRMKDLSPVRKEVGALILEAFPNDEALRKVIDQPPL